MEWTTETPTESGWYWWRDEGVEPDCVWVSAGPNAKVWTIQQGSDYLGTQGGEWYGPLAPPD